MLTVEIRVNTTLIGHLYIQNVESLNAGIYRYEYIYYRPERNMKIRKGKIDHTRDDGSEILIRNILSKIVEKGV